MKRFHAHTTVIGKSKAIITLAPGAYTAMVSGVGAAPSGIATIEVYELP